MHIDEKYRLLEHVYKSVKRMILHCYYFNREINLLLISNLDWGASIDQVKNALKFNILHQYAYFLHVLMSNDWMNTFMEKKWS